MTLPAIAKAFEEHRDKPERGLYTRPPDANPETFEETMANGDVRVMHRGAPGCAAVCIEIRKKEKADG